MPIRPSRLLFASILLSLISGSTSVRAQDDGSAEVRAVINRLFEGMRTGDSSLVKSTFHPDATLHTVSADPSGNVKVDKSRISALIEAVGTPHKEVYDERIYDVSIRVDGPMSVAWVPYKFYVGERFSHCGTNAFTLVRTGAVWKIAAIIDTRRPGDCP